MSGEDDKKNHGAECTVAKDQGNVDVQSTGALREGRIIPLTVETGLIRAKKTVFMKCASFL
jgi:hypothetical protein